MAARSCSRITKALPKNLPSISDGGKYYKNLQATDKERFDVNSEINPHVPSQSFYANPDHFLTDHRSPAGV